MDSEKTQYILKGIVHPERATLTLEKPIKPIEVIHYSSGKKLDIELNILCNQITIWIETTDEWDIYDLRNVGRHFVLSFCSVLTFIHGYYYEIEIYQILCKEKQIDVVFGIDTPCISNRASIKSLKNNFKNILNVTSDETGVFFVRCFKDLNLALKDSEDTAFYCFRAIECLRQYCKYKYKIKDKDGQWKKVWEISNYSREYIKCIENGAGYIRHGDDLLKSDASDREDYLIKTWNVIENFIQKEFLNELNKQ